MAATSKPKKKTVRQLSIEHGFSSGFEEVLSDTLTRKGVAFSYEDLVIPFTRPARSCKYTPDFALLANGIIVESKGRFLPDDRQKHLLVQAQHPKLDIRFVFSSSRTKLSKRSPTTYGAWCEKNGFLYADKQIPEAWLNEPPNTESLELFEALRKKKKT